MEKKVTLWCTKCQRGVGGHPLQDSLKADDYCPWCKEKEDHKGQYADYDSICLLRTTDDVADEDREIAKLRKMEAKVIRGQETPTEFRSKIKAEFDEQVKAQDAKIADLTAKLEKLTTKK